MAVAKTAGSDQGEILIKLDNPRRAVFSLTKSIFKVEPIMEIIFSQLDTRSLLECRMISSVWGRLGAAELRQRISIKLNFIVATPAYANSKEKQFMLTSNGPRPLLHQFCSPGGVANLEPSTDQNPLFTILASVISTSKIFPCSSFEICTETLASPQMQKLLYVAGPFLQRLHLVIKNSDVLSSSIHESSVFSDIKKLLSVQAPRLKSFELKIDFPVHWIQEMKTKDFDFSFLETALMDSVKLSCFPHLKTLKLYSHLPYSFFRSLMNSAVNLKEFECLHFGRYFTENGGKSRLHLLKHIEFELTIESESEIVHHILRADKTQVNIESLRITISSQFFGNEMFTFDQQKDAVNILNELLQKCRKSIKQMSIQSLRSLPGLIIPKMHKLHSLLLLKDPRDFIDTSFENFFFYNGFSAITLFPVLKSITIVCHEHLFAYPFDEDLRYLIRLPHPLPTVRFLCLTMESRISAETNKVMAESLPNAVLTVVYEEMHE